MNTLRSALLTILLGVASDAPADAAANSAQPDGLIVPPKTYRVGAFGPGCDFASLQAAINAASDRDTILVSTDAIHPVQAIISHSLTITGGFADCMATSPSSHPTQIITPGAGRPLTLFNGAANLLRFRFTALTISGGNSSNGGAIYADGNMELTLRDLTLTANEAQSTGGGITLFDGADLIVDGVVTIGRNTAPIGAGLRCEEGSILVRGRLAVNENDGVNTGGVSLVNCDLTSLPGATLQLDSNSASSVGALSAVGTSQISLEGQTMVRFNSTGVGPAIHIQGPAGLRATGPETILQSNSAASASASMLLATNGANIQLGSDAGPCSLTLLNSTISQACVAIAGNRTIIGSGAIALSQASQLRLHRGIVTGNLSLSEDSHFAIAASGSNLGIFSSVLFEHVEEGPIISLNNAFLEMAASTVINNSNAAEIIRSTNSASASLHAMLAFANEGPLLTIGSGSAASGTCLFLEAGSDAAGLPVSGTVSGPDFNEPNFALRDFRPSESSIFVDRCSDVIPLPAHDLNGNVRPYDLPSVPNLPGSYDAGAFERIEESAFADSFEAMLAP